MLTQGPSSLAVANLAIIKIIVSDATRLGCHLLVNVLERCRYKLQVVTFAYHSQRVLDAVAEHRPDIVLISAELADGKNAGFDALRKLRSSHPGLKSIMLLNDSIREHVVESFRHGARGVFCRTQSPSILPKCIAAVHEGQIWAGNQELQFLLEALTATMPFRVINAKGEDLLTNRELQVVMLVAEGLSNREVAQHLRLSEHTVKNYMFRIFDKLGLSSRAELILYAVGQREVPNQTAA